MERFEDRYALLKVAYSDMEFAVTRSFLEANGIKVTTANIEIFVDPGDLEEAKKLLKTDFSELAEEEWH